MVNDAKWRESLFVALDVHKHYVLAAIEVTQKVVLSPRKINMQQFEDWAQAQLLPSEAVVLDQRIATERWEIVHEPEEERSEVRDSYRQKGLRGGLLDRVVKELTADEDRWLRTLVQDEHGQVEGTRPRPAWQQGSLIGMAFVVGGLVPTLAFLFHLPQPRFWSYGLTALVAVALGALKARYTRKGVVRSSLEFLGIVTLGTLAGVVIGLLLQAV